jgi:hypothetical protein
MTRTTRAFTLVELLVVVGVIALLIGVLVPALAGARNAGRATVSLSQMRQLATGWAVYCMDEDEVIVPGQAGRYADEQRNIVDVGNGRHYRPRWFAAIGAKADLYAYTVPSEDPADEHSYPVTNPALLCPMAPDWTSTRNYPYGYNYQFLGNSRFRGDDESRGYVHYPVRHSRILSFSGTVMFASCMGTAAGKPETARVPNRTDGSRHPGGLALGGHGYALDPPRLTATSDLADTRLPGFEHRSGPDPRYAGKAHTTFCDGSTRAMTLREMGYQVDSEGRVLPDGLEASNALFSGRGADADPPDAT